MKQELATTSSFLLKWKRQLTVTRQELFKSGESKSEDAPAEQVTQTDWVTPKQFSIAEPDSESSRASS